MSVPNSSAYKFYVPYKCLQLLRRRRYFLNSHKRRGTQYGQKGVPEGLDKARLDGFLAESEGPIRVPRLSCFATTQTFSSAQSGSGQPPDRAQICSYDDVPGFGPLKWNSK